MSIYYQGSVEQFAQESKLEVNAFLQKDNHVVLGTKQGDGIHLTVMGFLKGVSTDVLYMQGNRQSQKVQNILKNQETEIAVSNGRGYMIVTCTTEILDDEESKKKHWEDWFIGYHPEGYMAKDYVVLKSIPKNIRVIL